MVNSAKKRRIVEDDDGRPKFTRLELDSHADTGLFGMESIFYNDTGIRVNVEMVKEDLGVLDVKVGGNAVTYVDSTNGWPNVLLYPQTLRIDDLPSHLANPHQMRCHGVRVNGCPLVMLPEDERRPESHSILVQGDDQVLHLPMSLRGVMSGIDVRKPTKEEMQDTEGKMCTHWQMTSDSEWDPHSGDWSRLEEELRDALNSNYDTKEFKNRQIYTHQVRRQEIGEPKVETVDEDESEYEYESDTESVKEESKRKIAAATRRERELLAQPLFKGGHFIDEYDMEWLHHGSIDASVPTPRDPRVVSSLKTMLGERFTSDALDVDSYAESMLNELGVTERGRIDPLEKLGRQLAAATTTKKRRGFVNAEQLAKNWGIGKEVAQRTIEVTTQLAVRDFSHNEGGRMMKPTSYVLNHRRLGADVYTDTMFGKCKSLDGNNCCQVFATDYHYIKAYPMKSKADCHMTLKEFFTDVGIPRVLIPDNAKEMVQGETRKVANKAQMPIHPIEAYKPNQNLAEDNIRESKRVFTRAMVKKNTPRPLWDRCFVWSTTVRRKVAWNIRKLNGQTPETIMTGDSDDISQMAEFGWYDWVYYHHPVTNEENATKKRLGRYIGASWNSGAAMCSTVFTEKAQRLDRTSVRPLTVAELNDPDVQAAMRKWEETLASVLKERVKGLKEGKDPVEMDNEWNLTPDTVPYQPYTAEDLDFDPEELEVKMPWVELKEADEMKESEQIDLDLNRYISAKVKVPQGGHNFAHGKVVARARDECGELIGHSNNNPILDTTVYDVEMEDGSIERYSANIIAEAIYEQLDKDGWSVSLLDEITDHMKDAQAISRAEGYTLGPNGTRKPKVTTVGWKLLARFKDGSEEWIKLKDFKESNPLEVADYALANKIDDEPAFAWWVPTVLKKRTRIIKAMKKRYFRTNMKFGIEVPNTMERAIKLDEENGNTFWTEAIKKEMSTVMVAFEILPEGSKPPPGYAELTCHLVFDLKAGSLLRKARFCGDGHKLEDPDVCTYASVVSRESVRLAFMLAALNGLDILAADAEGTDRRAGGNAARHAGSLLSSLEGGRAGARIA